MLISTFPSSFSLLPDCSAASLVGDCDGAYDFEPRLCVYGVPVDSRNGNVDEPQRGYRLVEPCG